MTDPARVVVGDDHPTVRASLRRVLEENGFSVCAEATDADATIEAALRERPDVCLIECLLPGNGVRAAGKIAARLPGTAVVMLTASRERDHLFDSVRAGAVGYLLKGMNPARLPHALRGVLNGEAAIPRNLVAALLGELQSHGRRRTVVGRRGLAGLSMREWEVLTLTAQQLSTTQIAERLFLSPVTVRRHISSVLLKLGASSRQDAVSILREQQG